MFIYYGSPLVSCLAPLNPPPRCPLPHSLFAHPSRSSSRLASRSSSRSHAVSSPVPFSSRPVFLDVPDELPPVLRSRHFVQLVFSFSPCLAVIIVSRPDDAGRVRIPHHGHAAGRQGANEPQETSRISIGLIWEHAAHAGTSHPIPARR